jgi:hypothetical protein
MGAGYTAHCTLHTAHDHTCAERGQDILHTFSAGHCISLVGGLSQGVCVHAPWVF